MAEVEIIRTPDLTSRRQVFVLAEDRVGHYPEFREFFRKTFDLDRVGLSEPGYVRAPSNMIYSFVFVGRSGSPFPEGVEIHAMADRLEPLDERNLDRDLWAILRWMINGVGGGWTVEDLEATGKLYRIEVAG